MVRKSRFFLVAALLTTAAGAGALGFSAFHVLGGEKRTAWSGSFAPGESPDVIVVLGMGPTPQNAIADRAELATEAWKAGFARNIVASGGQGPDEDETEARTLRNLLVGFGVPEAAIVEESTSTSTYENLANTAAVLKGLGLSGAKVLVVTHDFHAARTEEVARAVGLRARVASTHGSRQDRYPFLFCRELLAFLKWRVLKK